MPTFSDHSMTALVNDLIRDEDKVKHAYRDSEGYWTIGVGHLIDKRRGGGLSDAAIDFILREDIEEVYVDLDRNISWWRDLPEDCRRGLCNMCFNLGWTRLSKFKNMLLALRQRDWNRAADEALDSKWARQVGDRAERIAELFRSAEIDL